MGYRRVRGDPRITPGWTDPGNSGNFRKNSGKTGKFRKIQKFACDISNESCWQAGSRAHNRIAEFWKNSRKISKNLKNLGKKWKNSGKPYFCRPKGDHPRVSIQNFSTVLRMCRRLSYKKSYKNGHCNEINNRKMFYGTYIAGKWLLLSDKVIKPCCYFKKHAVSVQIYLSCHIY